MIPTMTCSIGLKSQSTGDIKLNGHHSGTKTTTVSPLLVSTNHSEPECEIHPNEEMWEQQSNSKSDCPFGTGKVHQHSSIDRLQKGSPHSQQDHMFQEQNKTVTLWEDHTSNTSSKNENEGKRTLKQKENVHAEVVSIEEDKKNGSNDVDNEDDESISCSIHLLREAAKDCISIKSDCCRSTAEVEDEEDVFSLSFFDTTLDTECDSSFCLDLEGTDSEIQIAVNEIRKEAAKMDTIMVLDQLKTMQTEFDSITKKNVATCLENEDLKIQIQESEGRVARLELERDLHQADATKLREDLKTLVSKMFDISMYESSESTTKSDAVDTQRSSISDDFIQSLKDTTSSNKILFPGIPGAKPSWNVVEKTPTTEKMRIVGLVDKPRYVVRRSRLLSDPGLICIQPRSKGNDFSENDNICLIPSSTEKQRLRNQNVFRIQNQHRVVRPRTKSIPIERRKGIAFPLDGRNKDIKGTIVHRHQSLSAIDTKCTSFTTETKLEEDEKENRRCGLFRRRSKRQSFSREDVSIMKHQINQLHEMMKTSVGASEKLRKRISTISQYYEGVISKLQTKVAEIKVEKSRAEVDLTNRFSQLDLERRLVTQKFEYALHRKDQEIARLKAEGDRGEV
uniref:Uncharacterized protein n=1 Tax=Pseudo-nitzschia australis TaxID=44445 RepID=A0A7S4AJN5_9STRA|mmetsp:Transcript_3172/g.6841  ORF Transcript_3172/g.6841 Transcript_3172/m.6841 type:complete len:622 (+) Transcript_3172:413-2278(+)